MVSPNAAAGYTYNLACTNADGFTEASQMLTVMAAGGGGGGGGGTLDLTALLALCGFAGARLVRERRAIAIRASAPRAR
jgi:hypothetical protein